MRIGLTLAPVFFLCAIALSQVQSKDMELLKAIQMMRADNKAAVTSGRGEATVSSEASEPHLGPVVGITEFVFSGSDCLWKVCSEKDYSLAGSVLLKDGKFTEFNPKVGRPGGYVKIDRQTGFETIRARFSMVPARWDTGGLLGIPVTVTPDETSFWDTAMAMSPQVTRDGTRVRLKWDNMSEGLRKSLAQGGSTREENVAVVFDTAKAGMVVAWTHNFDETNKRAGIRIACQQEGKISWRESHGAFVPERIEVSNRNPADNTIAHAKVDFRKFEVGPISPNELSFGALGVPTGTIVVDKVIGTEYRHADMREPVDNDTGDAAIGGAIRQCSTRATTNPAVAAYPAAPRVPGNPSQGLVGNKQINDKASTVHWYRWLLPPAAIVMLLIIFWKKHGSRSR